MQLLINTAIKALFKYGMNYGAGVLAAHGFLTGTQSTQLAALVLTAISGAIHWHDSHSAAVVANPPGIALSPKAATVAQAAGLFLVCALPCLFAGCSILPKDVAHAMNFTEDGTKAKIGVDPVSQMPTLAFGREQANFTIVPIVFQTNTASGAISAVIPDVVESYEFNGRNATFGGMSGTITFATGSNAVETITGGQHQPINEGTGTTLPK